MTKKRDLPRWLYWLLQALLMTVAVLTLYWGCTLIVYYAMSQNLPVDDIANSAPRAPLTVLLMGIGCLVLNGVTLYLSRHLQQSLYNKR